MRNWVRVKANLFFSPISIQTALAMTSAGARGVTATEMRSTLHLDGGNTVNENLGGFLAQLNADGKDRRVRIGRRKLAVGCNGLSVHA